MSVVRMVVYAGLLLMPGMVRAQRGTGLITGVVADSSGRGLPEVQILVVGYGKPLVTDSSGRFRIGPVRPASYMMQFRRLGFTGINHVTTVEDGDTVNMAVEMLPALNTLATVDVIGESPVNRLERFGFTRRRMSEVVPASRFMTRAEIDKLQPLTITELLRRMGGFVFRCVGPTTIYVDGTLLASPVPPPRPQKGSGPPAADIGIPWSQALDAIPPAMVEAIETYVGPAEFPVEYKAAGRGFGCLILIWTRGG